MTTIIGLCGPMGAGKTTVGKLLRGRHSKPVNAPFAAPLKSMMSALGVPHSNVHGTQDDKEAPLDILDGHSARHAMQTLGTEWGRNCISPNLWVLAWRNEVGRSIGIGADIIVADDVRFENEVQAIKDMGGLVIRVVRTMGEAQMNAEGRYFSHASEQHHCLSYDYTMVNDASLSDLVNTVDYVITSIIRQRLPQQQQQRATR